MELERILTIFWTVVMGLFILWGYFEILYRSIYVKDGTGRNNPTNKWLFAVLYWKDYIFYVWCLSAFSAAVSFLVLFLDVICTREWIGDAGGVGGFVISFNMFLLFASFYSFLVFRVFREAETSPDNTFYSRWLVIIDLLCVAAAAISMLCYICQAFPESWLILFSAILAFHCTVTDLMLWGYTWYNHKLAGVFHANSVSHIFRAAIDTDPSTMGIFTRLRIRHADIA